MQGGKWALWIWQGNCHLSRVEVGLDLLRDCSRLGSCLHSAPSHPAPQNCGLALPPALPCHISLLLSPKGSYTSFKASLKCSHLCEHFLPPSSKFWVWSICFNPGMWVTPEPLLLPGIFLHLQQGRPMPPWEWGYSFLDAFLPKIVCAHEHMHSHLCLFSIRGVILQLPLHVSILQRGSPFQLP